MIGIIYFTTAGFLFILPFFSGHPCLAVLFYLLTYLTPTAALPVQWGVLLAWLFAANYVIQPVHGGIKIPDEFYLYMLHALVFTAAAPFSKSRIEQLSDSRIKPLLFLLRYMLYCSAILFLISSLFRHYPASNIIWAMVCCIYTHYLPKTNSTASPVHIIKRAALYSFLLLLAFILVEIEVRLFLAAPPPPGGHYMPHSETIFTTRPDSRDVVYLKDNTGAMSTPLMTISSQGLRDQDFGLKQPDEYRVILLGDSFTMGHGLEAEETIDSVLEPLLNAVGTGKKVQVINCGVGGFAPWQERIFLQETGFPLEPDMVILQLFPANDVAGSYSKVNKYLHAIDPQWEYDLMNYHRRNQHLSLRMERKCKQYSSAYRLLLSIIRSNGFIAPLFTNCRLLPPLTLPHIVTQSNRPFIYEVCLEDWYPELHEAWKIYADSIRGIRDDCMDKGVVFAAYAHGNPTSLRPDVWQELNKQYPETPYEMNKDIRLTNELLDELNIPRIDAFSALSPYPHDEVYFVYDDHFSQKGASVIAKCLGDYILNNHLIQ